MHVVEDRIRLFAGGMFKVGIALLPEVKISFIIIGVQYLINRHKVLLAGFRNNYHLFGNIAPVS